MDKNYYLNRYGKCEDINLPNTHRVYFDAFCDEYSRYPVQEKLLDLAYVIVHGFDIKNAVRNILESHSYVSERAIHQAILDLTAAVNHVEYLNDRKNSLETDIDIFIEDLLRCYRLPLDNSIPHFLVDDFREVSQQTVYRSNGWEIAAKNVNRYQMYKYEDFVSFPGDAELLQKYHQEDIDTGSIGQIFPVGPCPEPWYGNPLTAKIIILGDMPCSDDFIDRCANIVLSFEPRLMEEVQIMVRNWMALSGMGMYNNKEFGQTDLCIGDAYNSVAYRHWIKELRILAQELKIDPQVLLNQVCVINANAYYAVGDNDPLAAGILPSQYYLRVLVNYLINNKVSDRPLFIIPSTRLHKIWKKVLGYWIENEVMLSPDRIIIDQPNNKLKLSATLLGKKNCNNLLRQLK